jgi:hypothetical protein
VKTANPGTETRDRLVVAFVQEGRRRTGPLPGDHWKLRFARSCANGLDRIPAGDYVVRSVRSYQGGRFLIVSLAIERQAQVLLHA